MKAGWLDRVDWIVEKAQRIAAAFSKLQWRLSITYTVVTGAILTLLFGIFMVYSIQLVTQNNQVGYMLTLALNEASAELAPLVMKGETGRAELGAWVGRSMSNGILFIRHVTDDTIKFSYSIQASDDSLIAITDLEGVTLASNQPGRLRVGAPLSALSEAERELVESAIRGELDLGKLHVLVDHRLLAAASLRDPQTGAVVGAAVVNVGQPGLWAVLLSSFSAAAGGGLVFVTAGGVMGVVFGFLTARGISRRLTAVADAAAAWGKGDFSKRVVDRSEDEIGLLARHLNEVAGQVEALMLTREELAAVEERNRLARDLHDSVKQEIFAASMNLGAAQALWENHAEAARERVDAAAQLSNQAQKELTLLIQTLRPSQLNEKGFAKALQEHLAHWEKNSGIVCQLTLGAGVDRLADEVQEGLFRVCQEALSNVARHSGASRASVQFQAGANGGVELTIRDDGHGFDVNLPSSGLGLRSMRERAQRLGGCCEIETTPAGTCVRVRV